MSLLAAQRGSYSPIDLYTMNGQRSAPMSNIEIRTVWRTASEHCEVVRGQFTAYRVRLWVENRLVLEETLYDANAAVRRAWELRVEWPQLVG